MANEHHAITNKHEVIKLDQNISDKLCGLNGRPNDDLVCTAVFYKNGEIRLFSPNGAQASQVTDSNAIKQRYNDVATNCHSNGKNGLAVYKQNPWIFTYTYAGTTYHVTIFP